MAEVEERVAPIIGIEKKDPLTVKILETAQFLFTKHGIEDVSMHQVAKTAGIGQGSLYRRYANKNQLCHALMKSKFRQFIDEVEAGLQAMGSKPVVVQLTWLMTKVIMLAGHNLKWLKVVVSSENLDDAKIHRFELPAFVFIREKVAGLLEQADHAGELVALDITFTSHLLVSAMTPEFIFYLNSQEYTVEEMADQYCRTFVVPLFKV